MNSWVGHAYGYFDFLGFSLSCYNKKIQNSSGLNRVEVYSLSSNDPGVARVRKVKTLCHFQCMHLSSRGLLLLPHLIPGNRKRETMCRVHTHAPKGMMQKWCTSYLFISHYLELTALHNWLQKGLGIAFVT